MIRLVASAAFALALTALALHGPAQAQTKWNLPNAYPPDNPHTENLLAFAKDVNDLTGGKLQIAVHANVRCSRRRRSSARCRPARRRRAKC